MMCDDAKQTAEGTGSAEHLLYIMFACRGAAQGWGSFGIGTQNGSFHDVIHYCRQQTAISE